MDTQRWIEAARIFDRQNSQRQEIFADRVPGADCLPLDWHRYQNNCQGIITDLKHFLASNEGRMAEKLLSASGRQVVIASEGVSDSMGVVYFLDGTGLKRSFEARGDGMVRDVPRPQVFPASVEEVADIAVRGGLTRKTIIRKIELTLDRIAQEVL